MRAALPLATLLALATLLPSAAMAGGACVGPACAMDASFPCAAGPAQSTYVEVRTASASTYVLGRDWRACGTGPQHQEGLRGETIAPLLYLGWSWGEGSDGECRVEASGYAVFTTYGVQRTGCPGGVSPPNPGWGGMLP